MNSWWTKLSYEFKKWLRKRAPDPSCKYLPCSKEWNNTFQSSKTHFLIFLFLLGMVSLFSVYCLMGFCQLVQGSVCDQGFSSMLVIFYVLGTISSSTEMSQGEYAFPLHPWVRTVFRPMEKGQFLSKKSAYFFCIWASLSDWSWQETDKTKRLKNVPYL